MLGRPSLVRRKFRVPEHLELFRGIRIGNACTIQVSRAHLTTPALQLSKLVLYLLEQVVLLEQRALDAKWNIVETKRLHRAASIAGCLQVRIGDLVPDSIGELLEAVEKAPHAIQGLKALNGRVPLAEFYWALGAIWVSLVQI